MKMTLNFNGSEAQLVELVDQLALEIDGSGLDSYDAGDALGWCFNQCVKEFYEFRVERHKMILHCIIEQDLFAWEGLETSQPVRR